MASPAQELILAAGIAAVGLVYVVVMAVEAAGSSRAARLLPDYCCFPTQHLLTVGGNGQRKSGFEL